MAGVPAAPTAASEWAVGRSHRDAPQACWQLALLHFALPHCASVLSLPPRPVQLRQRERRQRGTRGGTGAREQRPRPQAAASGRAWGTCGPPRTATCACSRHAAGLYRATPTPALRSCCCPAGAAPHAARGCREFGGCCHQGSAAGHSNGGGHSARLLDWWHGARPLGWWRTWARPRRPRPWPLGCGSRWRRTLRPPCRRAVALAGSIRVSARPSCLSVCTAQYG